MSFYVMIASVMLILGYTSYVIVLTDERSKRVTCMTGMMIAMTNAMMSSTVLGIILGIFFLPELAVPTMLAVAIGMLAGYLTGKSVSLMSILDGLMAGVMGGMMGAMIGVMLAPKTMNLLVIFFDIVYVIIMALLVKMIKEETDDGSMKAKKEQSVEEARRKQLGFTFMGVLVVLVLVIFMVGNMMNHSGASNTPSGSIEPKVEMKDGVQYATIVATSNGYDSPNTQIKAGVPTKIKFVADQTAGCSRSVWSKQLNFRELINVGEEKIVDVGTLQPGTYDFGCTMNMYFGKITAQ